MVETNIDDMSSELLGNEFQENLMKAGAFDFYYTQIIMKKGRPGVLVSVFVTDKKLQDVTSHHRKTLASHQGIAEQPYCLSIAH